MSVYKLEPIVKKISSQIVVCIGGQRFEYCSGAELSEARFDKRYIIDKIFAESDRVCIVLKEAEINGTDWCENKDVGFF